MIPQRIKLQGFLCYREEQEIAFDSSSLWMLSGLNGSGKSSIFDAVTYALFGHHRGGSQGAAELITKGENGLAVEFDFTLDAQRYQIRRTLRRKGSGTTATQQISGWQIETGRGKWLAVADTHLKKEFEQWIADHIGLNFETFTSSVLLLQGRAEKLLDSTAKGRAEVLASIVDLERYQKLHEKADNRRKTLRVQAEAMQAQWQAIPDVTDFELAAVTNRIDDAAAAVHQAQQEVEAFQALEFQSRQWAELKRKLAAAEIRRDQAAQLTREAAEIDRDLKRLRELRDALPHVETAFLNRTDLARAEDSARQIASAVAALHTQLTESDHLLAQTRLKLTNLQKRIATEEQRQQEAAGKLPGLSALLERVKFIEQQRDALAREEKELAAAPADLAQRLADTQKRLDELVALQQALPPLGRLLQFHSELRSATTHRDRALKSERDIQAQGEKIKADGEALRPQVDDARARLRAAQDALSSHKALLQEAAKLREEFDRLDGAKVCRACGQPLTPAHFREEKVRRDHAWVEADAKTKTATATWQAAAAQETKLTQQLQSLDTNLQSARDAYRDAHNELQQSEKDIGRLAQECGRAYDELAEPFRARVGKTMPEDWLAAPFLSEDFLQEARSQARELPGLRKEFDAQNEAVNRWNQLRVRVSAARTALADMIAALGVDPAEIRREFTQVDSDAKALAEQLKTMKRQERTFQTDIERFSSESQKLRERIGEATGNLQREEEAKKRCQQALANARKLLAPHWQEQADRLALAEWNRLRTERGDLEERGLEARAAQLHQARIELESLRQTMADWERELDLFPTDARCDPQQWQERIRVAKASAAARADALNAAKSEQATLQQRQKQREEVRTQLDTTELELNRYKTLAELLGRDRLQRHLVRQAERQIIDYANGILDRLSGGELMLRLVGTDDGAGADRALELEAFNRATGQSPINIAFLSGSQRFRVAVGLALGIGQYASRQHRPIESVIIDEGFGCLDRNGRQVMIQELQNLRGHLHCIMLVSHQEEFAEAFSNGYRFELSNGSTKVTRFQR